MTLPRLGLLPKQSNLARRALVREVPQNISDILSKKRPNADMREPHGHGNMTTSAALHQLGLHGIVEKLDKSHSEYMEACFTEQNLND